MSERTPRGPTASVQKRLDEIARQLREADHLDPQAQATMADLLAELSRSIEPGSIDSEHSVRLIESAEQLGRALHERHEKGLLDSAKDGLREAAARAEAEAPVATGVVRRFLDALANMGI